MTWEKLKNICMQILEMGNSLNALKDDKLVGGVVACKCNSVFCFGQKQAIGPVLGPRLQFPRL